MAALVQVPKSESALRQAYHKYVGLQHRITRIKEESETTVGRLVHSTVTVGSAALFGAIQGMYYDPSDEKKSGVLLFKKIPIELAVGGAAHIGALMGFGGKYAEHVAAVGDGALCAWLSNVARGWGYNTQKDKAKSKTGGASLREELESLVNS